MTTHFKFFEGTRRETQTPQVTVRRSGQMVLTPPAVANTRRALPSKGDVSYARRAEV